VVVADKTEPVAATATVIEKAPAPSPKTQSSESEPTAQPSGPAKSEATESTAAVPTDTRFDNLEIIDQRDSIAPAPAAIHKNELPTSVLARNELQPPSKVNLAEPAERVVEFSEYEAPVIDKILPEASAKDEILSEPLAEEVIAATKVTGAEKAIIDEVFEDRFQPDSDPGPIAAFQTQLESQIPSDVSGFESPQDEEVDILFTGASEPEFTPDSDPKTSIAGTETNFTPAPEFEQPILELDFEITPQDILVAETITKEVFQEKLQELFEPLPPEQTEDAIELIEAIVELIAELPEEVSNQEETPQPQELQELCAQLFKLMDPEYDEEVISKFIAGISLMEAQANQAKTAASFTFKTGTREKKLTNYLILRNLSVLMSQKQPRHVMLGRYALGMNLTSVRPTTLYLAA
jgi:hypothetical protein